MNSLPLSLWRLSGYVFDKDVWQRWQLGMYGRKLLYYHGAVDTTGIMSVFSLMEVLIAQAGHLLIYACTSSCVMPICFSEIAEQVLW
jgi:hypothetical protein